MLTGGVAGAASGARTGCARGGAAAMAIDARAESGAIVTSAGAAATGALNGSRVHVHCRGLTGGVRFGAIDSIPG